MTTSTTIVILTFFIKKKKKIQSRLMKVLFEELVLIFLGYFLLDRLMVKAFLSLVLIYFKKNPFDLKTVVSSCDSL